MTRNAWRHGSNNAITSLAANHRAVQHY